MPATATKRTKKAAPPESVTPEIPNPNVPQPDDDGGKTLHDRAEALVTEAKETADDPPKRKRGRPKGSTNRKSKAAQEAEAQAQAEAERAQTVGMLTIAFTATGAALVDRASLEPPFTSEHGRALAEAWEPVLRHYLKESASPWIPAISTTAIVLAPYALQMLARVRSSDNVNALPKGTEVNS